MRTILKYLILVSIAIIGFFLLASTDIPLVFIVQGYKIYLKSSLLIVLVAVLYLLLRMLRTVLLIPYRMCRKLLGYTHYIQVPQFLLAANDNYISSNYEDCRILLDKLNSRLLHGQQLTNFHLLNSLHNINEDQRIFSLKYLAEHNEQYVRLFAYRHLAKVYAQEGNSRKVLEYTSKILDYRSDNEALIIALDAAINLAMWHKVKDLLNLLENVEYIDDPRFINYYISIARHELSIGNEDIALRYLDCGLAHQPAHNTAISLYCAINFSSHTPERNLKVLARALKTEVSLELFALYHKSMPSGIEDQKVFEEFIDLINVEHHNLEPLIAICAYLKLPHHLDHFVNIIKQAHKDFLQPKY